MASVSAGHIVRRALRLCGVLAAGESLPADDAQDGLAVLNSLLELWRLQKLLVYAISRTTMATVAGTATYTIGAGGAWNTTRPVRIEQAGFVDSSQSPSVETPITILTDTQYENIVLKGQQGNWVLWLYYRPKYPLGEVVLWPVPTTARQVALYLWEPLAAVGTIQATVDLPPGYQIALEYNLAVLLAGEYGVTFPPNTAGASVPELAESTKGILMKQNLAMPPVMRYGDLQSAVRRKLGTYNPVADIYNY